MCEFVAGNFGFGGLESLSFLDKISHDSGCGQGTVLGSVGEC